MTDRPILFSAPMIRAILDGRKTQTRRVVKITDHLADKKFTGELVDYYGDGRLGMVVDGSTLVQPINIAIGDRLWVRETWAQHHPAGVQEGRFSIEGRAGIPGPPGVTYRVIYRADGDPMRVWHCSEYPYRSASGPSDEVDARHPDVCSEMPGWTPSVHMPRWASRLTLIVTDVRVQRLQDISAEDCQREGARPSTGDICRDGYMLAHRQYFRTNWNSSHGPDAWDANPWVSAISFEVVKKNIDAIGDRGICRDCMGSGESTADQICQTCNGSGADHD